MNTSAVILVIVLLTSSTVILGEFQGRFDKAALLELDDILVERNITKPDEDRVNKDLKTLIEEAIRDLEAYVEHCPDTEERELSLITIKALDDELNNIINDANGNNGHESTPLGQESTTALNDNTQ